MSNTIISRNNLESIDEKIRWINKTLSEKLTWLGTNNFYGLIEKNQKEGKNIPLVYLQEKKYIDPFFNDVLTSSVAWYETYREFGSVPQSTVELICTQKIKDVYLTDDRNLSKSINEICVLLKKYGLVKEFGKTKTGLDVFSDFDKKYIDHRDLHPWAVFSIELKIIYKK
jgi:hypothetical protein